MSRPPLCTCNEHERPGPDVGYLDCHVSQLPHGEAIICVRGAVDSCTAPVLSALLTEQLTLMPRFAGLEIILAETTFLDARGITTLLIAAQDAQRRQLDFRITGCPARLLRVFGVAGVHGLLAVCS